MFVCHGNYYEPTRRGRAAGLKDRIQQIRTGNTIAESNGNKQLSLCEVARPGEWADYYLRKLRRNGEPDKLKDWRN
jgi:hypothetical protein